MTRRAREVVIVGRDWAAWIVALGLRRAVGRIGVNVRVVELPSMVDRLNVVVALPSLAGLHALLGLDDATVFERCGGVPMLGQRFVGWSGGDTSFIHAYDIQRPAIDDIDFLQFWVKATERGLRVALEEFSLAAVAAKQGRVSDAKGGPNSLAGFTPGYHLDASAYAALLREATIKAGVAHGAATLRDIERRDERIVAVTLDDGTRVEGDLFIDASGSEAVLMADAERTSWRDRFGCDRIVAMSGPPLRPLPAYGQVSAFDTGWIGLFPLRGRTALVAACQAEGRSDEELVERLAGLAGIRLGTDAVVSPFAAGALTRPWTGNCIAIGEAAVTLEPLDAVQPQIVQIGLSNLVALWPVDADAAVEADAYNAAVHSHVANLRDFQLAHYLLNRRVGEPWWDRTRAVPPSGRLTEKLSLFAARGQIPLHDDESFAGHNWSALFVGHGVIPRSYDPRVDKVSDEEQIGKIRALLHVIADEVRAMPTVEQYLARRPT